MNSDTRYVPVENALPATLPPLDRASSIRFAKRLVRHFGRLGLGSPNQLRPADLDDWRWANGRRVWISTKPTQQANHWRGWGRLIHDVSHLVFAKRHPTARPHDGGHATLEREMAEYVVVKGWLQPKPVKERPNPRVLAYERAKVRLKKWLSREKRAHNAIRKLRRQLAYYERSLQH